MEYSSLYTRLFNQLSRINSSHSVSEFPFRRGLDDIIRILFAITLFIYLRYKRIEYCTGCGTCSVHNKPCPQKDDATGVIDKMVAADAIVMATPVYFYTMSAQMKTLIDRCCSLYTKMSNKDFYFIATAAEEDKKLMERTIDTFQGFLDCLENPTIKGVVLCAGAWHVGEVKDNPAMSEAYEMGKGIR